MLSPIAMEYGAHAPADIKLQGTGFFHTFTAGFSRLCCPVRLIIAHASALDYRSRNITNSDTSASTTPPEPPSDNVSRSSPLSRTNIAACHGTNFAPPAPVVLHTRRESSPSHSFSPELVFSRKHSTLLDGTRSYPIYSTVKHSAIW
jgi:hypothetical protein